MCPFFLPEKKSMPENYKKTLHANSYKIHLSDIKGLFRSRQHCLVEKPTLPNLAGYAVGGRWFLKYPGPTP